jgi:hypothetical protein
MSALSRRSIVASAAALLALAVPALLEYALSECDRLSGDDLPVCYFDDHAELNEFIRSMTECVRSLTV